MSIRGAGARETPARAAAAAADDATRRARADLLAHEALALDADLARAPVELLQAEARARRQYE